jgi:hypothetical protein
MKTKKKVLSGDLVQVIELLPSMQDALGSIPSPEKKTKGKEKGEGKGREREKISSLSIQAKGSINY